MSTLTKKTDKEIIADLEAEVTKQKAEADHYKDEWIKVQRESSKHLADGMEKAQLEKKIEVINLITAGKHDQAIQEILKPLPVLFSLNVRFADDRTRLKAHDEMLASIVKKLKDVLDTATVQRTDEEKVDEVTKELNNYGSNEMSTL